MVILSTFFLNYIFVSLKFKLCNLKTVHWLNFSFEKFFYQLFNLEKMNLRFKIDRNQKFLGQMQIILSRIFSYTSDLSMIYGRKF